jgi:hypothetical protein
MTKARSLHLSFGLALMLGSDWILLLMGGAILIEPAGGRIKVPAIFPALRETISC